jgi:hypothetical protein
VIPYGSIIGKERGVSEEDGLTKIKFSLFKSADRWLESGKVH